MAKFATLYAVTTSAGLIDQITDQEIDPGIETLVASGDGDVDARFAAVMQQNPMLSFTTTALAKALAIAGINGLALAANLDFYFRQVAPDGLRSTGAAHTRLRTTKGLLLPRTLRAAQDSEATIQYQAIARGETADTTPPLAVTTNVALAGTPDVTEVFTLGPVYINGVLLDMIEETTVDFGLTEYRRRFNGLPFPTFTAIQDRRPTITCRTLDSEALSIIGVGGTPQGATASAIYFRKLLEGGTRVPNITAQHIKIEIEAGMIHSRPARGANNEPIGTEIVFVPTFDGTNDVMIVNTASAIP